MRNVMYTTNLRLIFKVPVEVCGRDSAFEHLERDLPVREFRAFLLFFLDHSDESRQSGGKQSSPSNEGNLFLLTNANIDRNVGSQDNSRDNCQWKNN